jgi:hypothetical protein
LVYNCYNVNEEGDLVFRFDAQLWQRPPGHYAGEVEDACGRVLALLDIDLGGGPDEASWVDVLFASAS